jgi:pimeloyl-ACP methyl ester carboxylesterase
VLVAIVAFFSWQAHRREVELRHDAAPSTGRFVHAGDVELFVQETGPPGGDPVVLIHGTGAWSEIWRETMSALGEQGFRAIAVDLPPFGYSEKPAGPAAYARERQAGRILALLDALQIPRATLVGHSVGGRPTIEAALEAPDRVTTLVLVDPALGFAADSTHFARNDPSWIVRALFGATPLRNALVASYAVNPLFTGRLFRSFVWNKSAVNDDRVRMLQRPFRLRGTTGAYGDWLAALFVLPDTSLASDFSSFKRLSMPVLFVWGRRDTVTPLWQGERLRALVSGAGLSVIDGAGHVPHVEATAEFDGVLLAFLDRGRCHAPEACLQPR